MRGVNRAGDEVEGKRGQQSPGGKPRTALLAPGSPTADVPVPAPRKAPAAALSSKGLGAGYGAGQRVKESIPEGPQQHGPRLPDPAHLTSCSEWPTRHLYDAKMFLILSDVFICSFSLYSISTCYGPGAGEAQLP